MSPFITTILLLPIAAIAADESDAVFFREKVQPILADNCFKCHSHEANKMKGGLVVDSRAALLNGGDTGAAFVPGKPEASLLIKAIRYEDDDLQMPPNKGTTKKLSDPQIATLTEWVRRGAPWPEEPKGQKMTTRPRGGISEEDRKWWAIQPLSQPQAPKVDDHGWGRNEVDAFVFQKLAEAKLAPAPQAAPEQFCRRIYFDLVGLPPTPLELAEFLSASKADRQTAVGELADKLLASPRYGERWARHWLDLVRFTESDGYKIDEYRPDAWRFRDYVVRAFNSDKRYDRFVQEQLAGDELWPNDPDAQTATGYLRCGIYEYNNRDVVGQRTTILNDITDVSADVFMGVGVQCARCHDHKFDPILQKDYFRLQAFFAPVLWTDSDAGTRGERMAHEEKMAAWESKTAGLRQKIVNVEAKTRARTRDEAIKRFSDEIQSIFAKPEKDRTPLELQIADIAFRQVTYEWNHLLSHMKGEEKDQLIRLQKELSAFDAEKPAPLPVILTATDIGPIAPPVFIPKKEQLGEIEPGFLTILDAAPAKAQPLTETTGRRTALAQWLTRPENPLSTRVIVNRVWQYHFGRGLVGTSSDFGKLGDRPTHPELLDWLTRRFLADGWSLKKLHRIIVTSATYQQAAAPTAMKIEGTTTDPENRLLWHFPTRRLDAEQVRDAILATTGELDTRIIGPSVGWEKPARTIYTKILRNTRDSLLEVFDAPEGFQSMSQRNTTTTPTQALTMFNGTWLLARARAFSDRVARESSADEGARAAAAMRLAWAREPSSAEIEAARRFLDAETQLIEARPAEMKPLTLTTEKMPFREGKGVVLSPGGVDRLFMRNSPTFPEGEFTLEAFVQLKSLYQDGQIRTIASLWDGDKKNPGWSFGITGKQSRYKPQTLVLLLNGTGSPANEAEPIFSGMTLEIGKPYYVAVAVRSDDTSPNGVTFYAKDLSNDDLPMQVAAVPHATSGGIAGKCDFTLGARGGEKHSVWDGLIDDVRLSRAALPAEQLLLNSAQATSEATVGYWRFENDSGLYKDSSSRGNDIEAKIVQTKPADPRRAAFVDFCHVLLNSNEFLYLD